MCAPYERISKLTQCLECHAQPAAKSGLLRSTKQVCRPGVPVETPRKELEYPDRFSPPPRPDDEVLEVLRTM